jgi:hypothetical protein
MRTQALVRLKNLSTDFTNKLRTSILNSPTGSREDPGHPIIAYRTRHVELQIFRALLHGAPRPYHREERSNDVPRISLEGVPSQSRSKRTREGSLSIHVLGLYMWEVDFSKYFLDLEKKNLKKIKINRCKRWK